MNTDKIIWFGRYEGWLRLLARGVRDRDVECIKKAAHLFDVMLPDNAVVVPMPAHTGRADAMLVVAKMTGRKVADCLRCAPHESNYSQKRDGFTPTWIPMFADGETPEGDLWIIDNVIASGVTANAAMCALPGARLCALAYSPFR